MFPVNDPDKQGVPLIVCGDFNGGPESAAIRFIEDGEVLPSFVEDGEPVTSSRKQLPLPKVLIDASTTVARPQLRPPPPTLVVPELISLLIKSNKPTSTATAEVAYNQPEFTDDVVGRLKRIYGRFATKTLVMQRMCEGSVEGTEQRSKVMSVDDVERWLLAINRALGRGSEYREAARQMGWNGDSREAGSDDDGQEQVDTGDNNAKPSYAIELPRDGFLSFDGFRKVYDQELRQGKFWGIAHDLTVMGEPLPSVGIYEARFDRIYFYPGPWTADAASDVAADRLAAMSENGNHTVGTKGKEAKADKAPPLWRVTTLTVMDFPCTEPCPNEREPSDHLPVAAQFAMMIKE
jgi:hypothetical protein